MIRFWVQKRFQKEPQKRIKNDPKTKKEKRTKIRTKLERFWLQKQPPKTPQNDSKTNKKSQHVYPCTVVESGVPRPCQRPGRRHEENGRPPHRWSEEGFSWADGTVVSSFQCQCVFGVRRLPCYVTHDPKYCFFRFGRRRGQF